MWKVSKDFSIEAAHSLPHLPEGHKCRHLHGHSYGITVVCHGDLDPEKAWVVDYAEISAAMEPILKQLDHQNLNEVLPFITTAENLAFWIYRRLLQTKLEPFLKAVKVRETEKTEVIYEPR